MVFPTTAMVKSALLTSTTRRDRRWRVLRDIQASHGALRLSELHRFADPAEAVATLAVRDGRAKALGFYLDRRRVHVGDPTTTLDAVSAPGRPTAAVAWTRSCWPRRVSWSAGSTNAPKITASPAPLAVGRSTLPTATRRTSAI
jgi:AAA domain